MNVFSRLNTRAMKTPRGLVTRNTSTRKNKIWNHPLIVMSEFLRAQQRIDEVNRRQHTDREHDHRFRTHINSPYLTRSQKCTYAIDNAKNAIVTTIQSTSCIGWSPETIWTGVLSLQPRLQNFTRIAIVARSSVCRRSGKNPGTRDPGVPWFPP